MPAVGPPDAVKFPPVVRRQLANGMKVWTIVEPGLAVVSVALVVPAGSANDPAERHGLVSLAGDLLDEGAGGRDAIALADALSRLGSRLAIDVGPDVTAISFAALARNFDPTLDVLADVLMRPHLADADFQRVRDLRRNRLRQLRQASGTVADRTFSAGVYGAHPYGHGTLGSTEALDRTTLGEVQSAWERLYRPVDSTLVVAGGVESDAVMRAVEAKLGAWTRNGQDLGSRFAGDSDRNDSRGPSSSRILLVDRPGSSQTELRVGHNGPPRSAPEYHALVTLNAVLGGQFTSRLNRNLRETRGITYGARTAFDMYRHAGTFACETSVQADATAVAVQEILAELTSIRTTGAVASDELAHAQASLTRGYVRHFETPAHHARGLVEIAAYDLPADTFDRFVPAIGAITPDDVTRAANGALFPDACTVVAVGDAATLRGPLEALGLPISAYEPEF